jgi:hypothetical protein
MLGLAVGMFDLMLANGLGDLKMPQGIHRGCLILVVMHAEADAFQ